VTHRASLRVMKRLVTLSALAVACFGAAGTAQAAEDPPPPQKHIKAVVVLIGANDYGLVAPEPIPAP
jgi:hypothetical protein